MEGLNLQEHLATLPDPLVDAKPPPVYATEDESLEAGKDRKVRAAFLKPKVHTEAVAKRILEGHLFRGRFHKDGDWVTLPGGQEVWQRKVSDYVGGIPYQFGKLVLTYAEVKGVSPGNPFAFANLDKSNNPREKSQHEKLTEAHDDGALAILVIGWWDALWDAQSIKIKRGSRTYTKWNKADTELTLMVIEWGMWLDFYHHHNYRSVRQRDRHLLDRHRITKVRNRWALDENHWWSDGTISRSFRQFE